MEDRMRWARIRWQRLVSAETSYSREDAFSSTRCSTTYQPSKSGSKHRTVIPCLARFKEEYEKVSKSYMNNSIRTTKYTLLNFIPMNLFEQFHRAANLYFLFIVVLNWVPLVEAFQKEITMIPLVVVLIIISFKDGLEDYRRYNFDKQINNIITKVYSKKHHQFVDKCWKEVHVGDFIRLSCNEIIPADMVLLHSSDPDSICHIETANLDGETNLKQRQVVKGFPEQGFEVNPEKFNSRIECESPNNDLNRFRGFMAANLYFLFIVVLNWVPLVEAFQKEITMIPLVVVLIIISFKDGLEDYRRYNFDKQINNIITKVYSKKHHQFVDKCWKEVHVGDFIRLSCNEIIPADMVLLHSSDPDSICHIETANLDGETNLKQRQVVKGFPEQGFEVNPEKFNSRIECESPNNDLNRFRGFMEHPNKERVGLYKENLLLRGCTIRNTEAVVGIVVYAGHETKAMLNNSGPRYKRSKMERRLNVDVLWSVVLLLLMCLTTAIEIIWLNNFAEDPPFVVPEPNGNQTHPALAGFYMFWTMIIVLQVLIPISLYVSIEIVKLGQIIFIQNDIDLYNRKLDLSIQCRALNITEDLGQIQYIFSDKTGTLTENKMVFRRCSIAGVEYSHDDNGKRLELYQDVDSDDEEYQTGTLNTKSNLKAQSCRTLSRPRSSSLNTRNSCPSLSVGDGQTDAHSPRHVAFSSRMAQFPDTVRTPLKSLEEMKQLFQRFSVRHFSTPSILNGTDSLSDSPSSFTSRLNIFKTRMKTPTEVKEKEEKASGSSQKDKPSENQSPCNTQYQPEAEEAAGSVPSRIESPATQPGAGELIYEAESPDEAALVHAARAYKCTLRARTPDQLTVQLAAVGDLNFQLLHILPFDSVRKRMSVVVRHPVTGQVVVYSKGADSVIMDLLDSSPKDDIQEKILRKIKEQTQRHLDDYAKEGLRTLCIAYKDCCEALLNTLIKEIRESVPGPSGEPVPGFSLVIDGKTLEYALHESLEETFLELTKQCRAVVCCRSTPLQKSQVVKLVRDKLDVLALAIGDGANDVSMIQVADVGIGISGQEGMQVYADSDIDVFSFGTPINTSALLIILLHLVLESKTLTWIHAVILIGSGLFYFVFALIFSATCVTCNSPANPIGIMEKYMSDPVFYLVCVLTTIVALLPRFVYRCAQSIFFPTPILKAAQFDKMTPEQRSREMKAWKDSQVCDLYGHTNPIGANATGDTVPAAQFDKMTPEQRSREMKAWKDSQVCDLYGHTNPIGANATGDTVPVRECSSPLTGCTGPASHVVRSGASQWSKSDGKDPSEHTKTHQNNTVPASDMTRTSVLQRFRSVPGALNCTFDEGEHEGESFNWTNRSCSVQEILLQANTAKSTP
ncbi:UNVERIFIED_CONTAM: hypothetical protein FKN15_046773 [Acipenser sinensis]